jgi:hypothetical protein
VPDTHLDDEQRYRPLARSSLWTGLTVLGLAGILALLGHPSVAVGFAAVGGASLAFAAVYSIMYRV